MGYVSYDNFCRSELYNIISAKDKLQGLRYS